MFPQNYQNNAKNAKKNIWTFSADFWTIEKITPTALNYTVI
jgi:endonuclease YncB( thermonuclease family)